MKNKNILIAFLMAFIGGFSALNGMHNKYINAGLYEISLKEAIERGMISDIEHLLDIGISPDMLLIHAAYHENVKIVRFLLEEGANPNAKDENGNTPLHFAIKQNSKCLNKNQAAIVKLLIEYFANPLIDNKYKESVINNSFLPQSTKNGIGMYAEKNFIIKSKF